MRVTTTDHYGLSTVELDNGHGYAVAANPRVANEAARLAAEETLWAFTPAFMADALDIQNERDRDNVRDALALIKDAMNENAEPLIRALIGNRLGAFLRKAIKVDGRGHFLSPYDGQELNGGSIDQSLKGLLVYRLY